MTEFDRVKINCGKCNEEQHLFFQKGSAVQRNDGGIDKATVQTIYDKLNEMLVKFEDFEARICKLEDFISEVTQRQQDSQQGPPTPY